MVGSYGKLATVACFLIGTLPHLPRTTFGQSSPTDTPALQMLLTRQRSYEIARYRREPVTPLLASGFIEIQADGRVLTRTEAIAKYARYDDPTATAMEGIWTSIHGDVAVIGG